MVVKNSLRYIILMFLACVCAVPLMAQRTYRAEAEYTYTCSKQTSIQEAERTAIEKARVEAIASVFGQQVTQTSTTLIHDGKVSFTSVGGIDIRAEWVRTVKEVVLDRSFDDKNDLMSITVFVSGEIREITASKIDFYSAVLCNGTSNQHSRTDFKHGDDLYLKFQSPVNGYVLIYLVDYTTDAAYCLLPYQQSNQVAYEVAGEREYTFFSPDHATSPEEAVNLDEYTLTCNNTQERNEIYIIFSTDRITKAKAESIDELRPRQLSLYDFHNWLAKLKKKNPNLSVKEEVINIKK